MPKVSFFNRFLARDRQKDSSLQERFRAFQSLLQANNEALEVMSDMEEKYASGEYILTVSISVPDIAGYGTGSRKWSRP